MHAPALSVAALSVALGPQRGHWPSSLSVAALGAALSVALSAALSAALPVTLIIKVLHLVYAVFGLGR